MGPAGIAVRVSGLVSVLRVRDLFLSVMAFRVAGVQGCCIMSATVASALGPWDFRRWLLIDHLERGLG
jgi:hypothetical protein